MKYLLTPLLILSIGYLLLGPVLLFVEFAIIGSDALIQAFPIALTAVFFFAYSMLSLTIFNRILKKGRKGLVGYYLADKMIRMILCIICVIIYGVIDKSGLITFSINLLILYLFTVIYCNIYCVKQDKNKN
jgi:amino acid transporter